MAGKRRISSALALSVYLVSVSGAEGGVARMNALRTQEESALQFLYKNVHSSGDAISKPRITIKSYDLNGDGQPEFLAYIYGRDWCGSGGCVLKILQYQNDSFKIRGDIDLVRPPILVLPRKARSWSDIGVWVGGGGNSAGYEVRLRFDGNKYPSYPIDSPRILGNRGKVLIR